MSNIIKKAVQFLIPQKDKLEHFYLWTIIFFGGLYFSLLLMALFPNLTISEWWSFGFAAFTAAWKEIVHDWIQGKGFPSLRDFLYGILCPTLYMIQIHFI